MYYADAETTLVQAGYGIEGMHFANNLTRFVFARILCISKKISCAHEKNSSQRRHPLVSAINTDSQCQDGIARALVAHARLFITKSSRRRVYVFFFV